jgi:hypothetical protein
MEQGTDGPSTIARVVKAFRDLQVWQLTSGSKADG